MSERPEMRLIRESLESVMAPTIASSLLFEAVELAGGRLPENTTEVVRFLEGPLARLLNDRLGAADTQPILEELTLTLNALGALAPKPNVRHGAEVTREVLLDALPVLVSVVSASESFAHALVGALGSECVMPLHSSTLAQFEDVARTAVPKIVLIDGGEFAEIEPDALAQALSLLPASTVRAIWGADLPYGSAMVHALAARKAAATPFDRTEGIAPLLDMIRSRRSSR
jgi:hypothetical protein